MIKNAWWLKSREPGAIAHFIAKCYIDKAHGDDHEAACGAVLDRRVMVTASSSRPKCKACAMLARES